MLRLIIPLLGCSFALGCSACSGSSTGASETAGAGGTTGWGGAAGTGGAVSAAGGASGGSADTAGAAGSGNEPWLTDCPDVVRPEGVPNTWHAFVDFACDQPIWYPTKAADVPDPIEWVPCGAEVDHIPGIACERIKVTWPYEGWGGAEVGQTKQTVGMEVPTDGSPARLFFMQTPNKLRDGTFKTDIVAEVDGPVLFAASVLHREPGDMTVTGIQGGRFGLALNSNAVNGDDDLRWQGLAVGRVGEFGLSLFQKTLTHTIYDWLVNDDLVMRGSSLENALVLYRWGESEPIEFHSSSQDPQGFSADGVVLSGPHAFADTGTLRQLAIHAYAPEKGAFPLIRWPDDFDQGAYNIGTDGKDMVWTHGTNHEDGEGVYLTKSVMTAPFTTDPAELERTQRRLRSDPAYGYGLNFRLGCGYAVHDAGRSNGMLIVRLSDGVSWLIPYRPDRNFEMDFPHGITCDELFVGALYEKADGKREQNIFRIRLDSLGPGIAPD